MSDYIKRDDAIKYNESQVNFCKQEGFPNPEWLHIDSIKNNIKLIPAADVVERKHGKWKKAYLDHEAFGIRPTVVYCSVGVLQRMVSSVHSQSNAHGKLKVRK